MAYYIGTQEFATIGEANDFIRRNPDVAEAGLRITSEPVQNEGMLTGETATTPQTFTFVEGKERGDAARNYLYGQEGEVQQLTVSELRDYFESDRVNRLPEVFGTFDNYLAYMTEREQLIQSGDYDVGNWSEADAGFTEDQEMILEGDADLTIDPSDPGQNIENLRRQQTDTQAGAYNNWINSEANQELLQKYGVAPVVYSNSGDKFAWNGSAYVKTQNEDHAGFADYVKMGIVTAIGIMSGGALAPALGSVGSAVTSSAISQAISTGSINPNQLLTSIATAGIGQALNQIIGPVLQEVMPGIDLSEITGIEIVDDALRAMGNSVIQQGIINGEVNINQVFTAGLFTTLDDVVDFFFNPNATEEEARSLWDNPMMREQAEDLNSQLANNFDTTVSGLIDAMDAETAAYFANLTSDLNEQLTDEGAWGVTTDFGLPDTPTATQYVEESLRGTALDPATYDNLTDDEARLYMERAGFTDDEINTYLGFRQPPEISNGLLYFSNTGMYHDPDMPFSINVRPDTGEYFIVNPNGDYKAISQEDAEALMAFEDANDWEGFANYLNERGIGGTADVAGGGVVFGGFTEDGRPIISGADYDDWLSSSASGGSRFVDVDFEFVDDPFESTIEEEETFEPQPEPQPEPEPEPQPQPEPEPEPQPQPEPEPEPQPDTTETGTGNAPGITEEMFQDVIDQVREDGEVETQEIIEAINALGIADLPTIAQIEEAFPELNDVSLEQIKDTVSTLLSEAGLLTAEQFTEAMANVLTPEQLATALADLPYGDAEDFAEAISNAGLATPEDITTALTDANLATSEDIAGLARAFVQSGFATPTDVVTALSESGLATPEDIATALSESGLATLEQIITAFTDSGLATSEDIAGLARTFTQSGFATPQDLADAFEAAGLATPQDVIDAISAAGLATPQDVADALEAFGFTDAQLEQITGALPEGLTTDQLNTALSDALAGIATGTDLDTATTTITDAIGALGFATPQDVRDALSEFGFTEAQLQQIVGALPEGLSVSDLDTALEGVVVGADLDTAVTTITDAISGLDIASAQDVRDALSEFNFSEDQLNQIINALPESLSTSDLATALENVVVGTDLDTAVTDITTAISGLDIASPDDVREILAEYGFTAEQLEQIAGSITIPESATVAEIQNIVNAIPAGLTAEEVATQLSSQFEGLTTGIAGVQGGIDQLAEDLGLSTEGLLTAIENLGTTSGEDLTELQTNILEGLGLLSQDLGVDIGDVVTSVTDLEAGLTENITGLSDQLTGVEEAVGGVTTAVNRGIEDLADALGVQTDDITSAIVTLGSGLGGELTELETSVLSGLSSLADSLGTDVGTVVDSIGGLGTDISANIQGLSDTLGEQLGAGFGGLGEQLGAGFGQLGQQLGLATLGLFGLGAKQPTAQQIAAAQDKFEFKPFEEQMKPRQVQQVVQARPVQQQPSALQQINKFIDRQSNISRPANQGMFTGDPNRKLA